MTSRTYAAPPAHYTRSRSFASMTTPPESESSRSADTQAHSAATFLYDATLAPAAFHGDGGQNAEEWLEYFQRYVAFKQLPHDVALPLFALLMRGPANTWFGALPEDDRESYTRATEASKPNSDRRHSINGKKLPNSGRARSQPPKPPRSTLQRC